MTAILNNYVVPNIETIVEIDGALRDAKGLIVAMRLLLEASPDETYTEPARDIAWIAMEKIDAARNRMEASEPKDTAPEGGRP